VKSNFKPALLVKLTPSVQKGSGPVMSEILLEMRNICKVFPGVHALKDVNLQVS
jgi:hypothetical protein